MTLSAFQPSAFQNNAFQIWSDTNIPFGGGVAKKKKKSVTALYKQYEEAVSIAGDNKKLLSAVDPYIAPQSGEEWERRSKAQYILESAPAAPRVDFARLYQNIMARQRLEAALSEIKLQLTLLNKQYQEAEELMLLMMLSEV